jgi:hypothetical protein
LSYISRAKFKLFLLIDFCALAVIEDETMPLGAAREEPILPAAPILAAVERPAIFDECTPGWVLALVVQKLDQIY